MGERYTFGDDERRPLLAESRMSVVPPRGSIGRRSSIFTRDTRDVTHMSVERSAAVLGSDCANGLPQALLTPLASFHGKNALTAEEPPSFLQIFFRLLRDPLILVIILGGVMCALFTVLIELKYGFGDANNDAATGGIFIVGGILSAFFGALSEYSNAEAGEALQALSAARTRVVRDGAEARNLERTARAGVGSVPRFEVRCKRLVPVLSSLVSSWS